VGFAYINGSIRKRMNLNYYKKGIKILISYGSSDQKIDYPNIMVLFTNDVLFYSGFVFRYEIIYFVGIVFITG
jgi:hypothetical protein